MTSTRACATLDDHGNPTGGVAKSWDVSDDGKIYTFHLRDDAKWSNGDPITADDVVYSFRRIVDPKVAAEYAYIYSPILNADDINSGKETDLTKLGVVAVDPHTVKITLKAPTPYLLGLLAHTSSPDRQQDRRREVRRSMDAAGQQRQQRRLHASPNGCRSRASSWSRIRTSMTRRT